MNSLTTTGILLTSKRAYTHHLQTFLESTQKIRKRD